MSPAVGELLHFSEEPTITRFIPHVAPTTSEPTAYVWAVDGILAPGYWCPRQCPRAMAWAANETWDDDQETGSSDLADRGCTQSNTTGWS